MKTLSGVVEVENGTFFVFDDLLDEQASTILFTGDLLCPGTGAVALTSNARDGFVHVTVTVLENGAHPMQETSDAGVSGEVSYPSVFGSQRIRAGTFGECFGELGQLLTPPGQSEITVRARREPVEPYALTNVRLNSAHTLPTVTITERFYLQVSSRPAQVAAPAASSWSKDYVGPDNEYFDGFPLHPNASGENCGPTTSEPTAPPRMGYR